MTTSTAPRMGLTYTDEDHDTLLGMLREGASTGEIALALGRTIKSVEQRARKLLPPGQRHCPLDRVMPTLAKVCAEPGYDWRATVCLDDPPAPINKIVRSGIEGLESPELVEFAHDLAVCFPQGPMFESVTAEVRKRGLVGDVVRRHELHRRLREEPDPDQAYEISTAWADAVGFGRPFGYHRDYEPIWG
ncbi:MULTISPECIES: hypothetical protein [unclassified Luteococcus]|uniref:hypothetical protein n=1 Tax=unclassified Luteococcus TaxID=2639923 RepID=UPI00313CF3B2